jgi:hypothetical protein
MGGVAWGGHSCPQAANGIGPRAGQRTRIIEVAEAIRAGGTPPPPVRTWTTAGLLSLADLAKEDLDELPSTVLRVTCENSPGGFFAANLAAHVNAVFAGDSAACPAGITWYAPVARGSFTSDGHTSLQDLAVRYKVQPSTVLRQTAESAPGKEFPAANAGYINQVFGRAKIKVPSGVVLHY